MKPIAFGIPITPDLLMKFAALILAAGVLYGKVESTGAMIQAELRNLQERVTRIETYIDGRTN